MRFLSLLAVSSILCSIASARSYAYDDPTLPSTPEPSSLTQPSQVKTQPSTTAPSTQQPSKRKAQPSTVAPSSPSSTLTRRNGDNPPVKNGMPCIEEICLGDDVKTLIGLSWTPTPASRLNSVNNENSVGVNIVGDPKALETFSRYGGSGGYAYLDRTGVAALAKIEGFCRSTRKVISAEYLNKKGLNVQVFFDIQPSPDGIGQKLIVGKIVKQLYAGNVTNEQAQDIERQVRQKYGDAYGYKTIDGYITEGSSSVNAYGTSLHLGLQIKEYPSMMMRLRGCGDSKINI